MPYKVSWRIPTRVIVSQFVGTTTYEEMLEHKATVLKLLQEGVVPVYHISDLTEFRSTNQNIEQFIEVSDFASHPKIRMVGIVGAGGIISASIELVSQAVEFRYFHEPTVEKALLFLGEIDSSLLQHFL